MSEFFDYVRGLTEVVPDGYSAQGMAVYRHHVYLGASQLLAASYPELKTALSEADWTSLMNDFIAKTRWSSNFYSDLDENFKHYLSDELNEPA